MGISGILTNALEGIAPVQAGDYDPGEDSDEVYIVFNYFTTPDDFGDDEPEHEVVSVQVHLFCPGGFNSLAMRKRIKKSLDSAGFTFPSATDLSDRDGQHHLFECMIAVGAGDE